MGFLLKHEEFNMILGFPSRQSIFFAGESTIEFLDFPAI
jgi:hypothetical protein